MVNTDDKDLYKTLKNLYEKAYCPKAEFEKYERYYNGDASNSPNENLPDAYNIIKQIIDTKKTMVIDNMVVTSVVADYSSFNNLNEIKEANNVADTLNDCVGHIRKINRFDSLKSKSTLNSLKFGIGFIETVWDADFKEMGDIKKSALNPINCKWDESAQTSADLQYFFLDSEMSTMDLKIQYCISENGEFDEDLAKKIDQLAMDKNNKEKGKITGIVSMIINDEAQQAYARSGSDGIENTGSKVMLHKVYLKDETVLKVVNSENETEKLEIKKKYPNGRVIIYAGNDANFIIFEDKPIEYEFGFPIDSFSPSDSDKMLGLSEIKPLIYIQDRINKAFFRLQTLIAKYISTICYDSKQLDLGEGDFINSFAIPIENMRTNGVPIVLTNNTLSEIVNVSNYIESLKSQAKEIARVNDIMISGERPDGVTSGEMVDALKESPQGSIRDIQRNLNQMLIDSTKKDIELIQRYYTMPRIIRISGNKFLEIPLKIENKERMLTIHNVDKNQTEQIKDFDIFNFEVDIIIGSDIHRSSYQNAILNEKLVSMNIIDINDIEELEIYLKSINYPNYRALIQQKKAKIEESQSAPMPISDKISVAFKDLPVGAQNEWLINNGFKFQIGAQVPEGVTANV